VQFAKLEACVPAQGYKARSKEPETRNFSSSTLYRYESSRPKEEKVPRGNPRTTWIVHPDYRKTIRFGENRRLAFRRAAPLPGSVAQ
jgi:hypothetical protein